MNLDDLHELLDMLNKHISGLNLMYRSDPDYVPDSLKRLRQSLIIARSNAHDAIRKCNTPAASAQAPVQPNVSNIDQKSVLERHGITTIPYSPTKAPQ